MSDKYPGGFVTANAPAGFSVALNGSSDSIKVPNGTQLAFGTGDFTVELWLNSTDTSGGIGALTGGSTGFWGFNLVSGSIYWQNSYGAANLYSVSATSILDGRWHHMAFCRSGTTHRVFFDGVQVNSTTDSTDYNGTTGNFVSGGPDPNSAYLQGYISNFRLIKGTALYTAAFTPPTQLFPISGTGALLCQSPTLIDTSSYAATVTTTGTPTVSNFTPFAAYQGFNPALGAAAGGVWTLDEAAYYQNNRQWPIYDPYFNQTTLMLHGNGTNGAQNNTFLDSSTNNFTITRNGNTTQGSFTPFSQTGWSTYFSGASGTRLTYPGSANTYVSGTGDFTIEMWINIDAASAGRSRVLIEGDVSNGIQFRLGPSNTTNINGLSVSRVFNADNEYCNFTFAFNTWYHVAVCRANAVYYFFVNGVQIPTQNVGQTSTYNFQVPSLVSIGDNASYPNDEIYKGYISNIRVSNVGRYTSSFTPSTAPFTAANGTQFLSLQNQRFVDNSANNSTITSVGSSSTPSIQAFSPFVPAYITPTTYSNRFAATSYLSIASNAAFALPGAFTIEFWIYFSTFEAANRLIAGVQTAGGLTFYTNGTTISPNVYGTGNIFTASNTVVAGQWYHYALSRDASNNMRMWVNGLSVGSTTTASSYAQGAYQINDSAGSMAFVISNLREVKGSTVYDPTQTNITPPTAPLTAISGTQLLTCQSSTFVDNSTNNFTITSSGTVQPVTSPTPFPANVDTTTLNSAYSTSLIGGSGYFDGTGDYVRTPTDVAFALGTSDFTFETWLYPTVAGNDSVVIDNRNPSGGIQGFAVSWATGSVIRVIVGAPNAWDVDQSTAAVGANSWIHYALTRSGTTFRIFLNGALVYTSGAISGSMGTTAVYATVGAAYNGANPFTGYFSGTRLIKGTCLYTSSFAPPLAPLTPVTNTSVLLNYTNAGIIDNAAKNVLETVGNAQISTTQSKWGGSSMSFNGTNSYLFIPNSPGLQLGSSDWTIECWVYLNSTTGDQRPISQNNSNYEFAFFMSSGGAMYAASYQSGGTTNFNISMGTLSTGQWYHLAASRSGSTVRAFVNGTLQNSATYSGTIDARTGGWRLGASYVPGDYFNGYINDARITKGVARYVTNFTPPTSQLQDQ